VEQFILTAGQLALALAGVASCIALVCIIVGMLRWLVRAAKSLQEIGRPVQRPHVGGGVRKW
jgi:hypothetical protein